MSDIKVQAKRSDDPVELLVYARKKDEKIILRHQDMPADLWVLGTDVLCVDVGKFTKVLREKNICPEHIITTVIEGTVALLNLPAAIQQKATLDAYKASNTFEVASRDAKNGKVECTVNKGHVKCRCHSFKYDSVCKHSIAVAERVGMLEEHIRHITKSSRKKGQRTTLA